jgi:hypothetical protein
VRGLSEDRDQAAGAGDGLHQLLLPQISTAQRIDITKDADTVLVETFRNAAGQAFVLPLVADKDAPAPDVIGIFLKQPDVAGAQGSRVLQQTADRAFVVQGLVGREA